MPPGGMDVGPLVLHLCLMGLGRTVQYPPDPALVKAATRNRYKLVSIFER